MASSKRQIRQIKPEKKSPKTNQTANTKNSGLSSKLLSPLKVFSFLIPSYFKNSFRELKQVTWPGRKETLKLTFAVFMFAIVFGLIITVTDYGLDVVFKKVLIK